MTKQQVLDRIEQLKAQRAEAVSLLERVRQEEQRVIQQIVALDGALAERALDLQAEPDAPATATPGGQI